MSEMIEFTMQTPQLTVTPASIAGKSRRVDIEFEAEAANISYVIATYDILGASAWQFGVPSPDWDHYKRPRKKVATRRFDRLPANNRYAVNVLLEKSGTAQQREASLKLGASVVAFGKGHQWKLSPVHSIGSIALLSDGLSELMEESKIPSVKNATTFEARALAFIQAKKNDPALREALGEKFAAFENLPDGTILNVFLGKTNSQEDTLKALSPVIAQFRKTGSFDSLLKVIKKEGLKGSVFDGVVKLIGERMPS